MPINTLAMEILRDFATDNGWDRHGWILASQQNGPAKGPAAGRAFSEAWQWLESRGLVAWDPAQHVNARFVTRLGHDALTHGVARMEAAARLGMQLHPQLAERVERQFLMGEYELAVFAEEKKEGLAKAAGGRLAAQ